MAIIRECRIYDVEFRFDDCTFEEAAKEAVMDYCRLKVTPIVGRGGVRDYEVLVRDPEACTERKIVIRAAVRLEWINPRQGVDY